jgi:aspartate aminotransferase
MDQSIIEERRIALQRKRDIAYEQSMPLFDCNKPQGAFYLFPDVTRHLKPGESSEDLALRLLEKAGVAVVPGKAFSGPGHVRISFGADETELYKGFEKIKEVL